MSNMILCINENGKEQEFPEATVKDAALMKSIGFYPKPKMDEVPPDLKNVFEPLKEEQPIEDEVKEDAAVTEPVVEEPAIVSEEPVVEPAAEETKPKKVTKK